MKIGLCGTQSVGKTTLVKALQNIPEFKGYVTRTERSKELMAVGIPLNTDSTTKGQAVFLAERASELMCENIITDRTIIDVMAFAKCSKSMYHFEADDFSRCAKAENSKVVELNDYEIVEIIPDHTMPYSYKFIVKACESPAFKPMLNRSSTN